MELTDMGPCVCLFIFNYHRPLHDLTFLLLFSIKTIVDIPFIQLVLRSFALYFARAHHSQIKTTDFFCLWARTIKFFYLAPISWETQMYRQGLKSASSVTHDRSSLPLLVGRV